MKVNLCIPVLLDGTEWFFLKGPRTSIGVLLAFMYAALVELGFNPNIKEHTLTQPGPQYFVYMVNDKKQGQFISNPTVPFRVSFTLYIG